MGIKQPYDEDDQDGPVYKPPKRPNVYIPDTGTGKGKPPPPPS